MTNATHEPTITCPNCQHAIKLTESLAAPLVESTKREFEQKLKSKEDEFRTREQTLATQKEEIAKAQAGIEEQVAIKLKAERSAIAQEEARKARTLLANDIEQQTKKVEELNEVLKERDIKLAAAQKAQAEIMQKERALADEKREMDLTIEKRIQEAQATIMAKAKLEATNELGLKVQEKEHTISAMQKQIEELKRKAEQGSQQLQGEVQEIELELMLSNSFPHDTITPVAKGELGADAVQQVNTPFGQNCGKILWESKRTKNWSDSWLAKLRDDQRAAKTEIAILVSQALPKDMETFEQIDGIWVTHPRYAIPLAMTLRHTLIEVANTRLISEGQQTKMEIIYQYLTGPRFRHRVEAIVEKFSDMQADLDKERKTMTKLWARREEQIRGVIDSTAGMYGDLQGIAGRALGEIEGLDIDDSNTKVDSPLSQSNLLDVLEITTPNN